MADRSIETLLSTSMQRLREMVDVDTIIGKPIETSDGTVVIPVSKVSFGYGIGGWDKASAQETVDKKAQFAGGSGGGVSVEPIAFLVIAGQNVKLLEVNAASPYAALAEKVPELISSISGLFKKSEDKE